MRRVRSRAVLSFELHRSVAIAGAWRQLHAVLWAEVPPERLRWCRMALRSFPPLVDELAHQRFHRDAPRSRLVLQPGLSCGLKPRTVIVVVISRTQGSKPRTLLLADQDQTGALAMLESDEHINILLISFKELWLRVVDQASIRILSQIDGHLQPVQMIIHCHERALGERLDPNPARVQDVLRNKGQHETSHFPELRLAG